jgi:hypothetical protein
VIKLHFQVPDDDDAWQTWVSECADALTSLAPGADRPRVNEDLYKRMRSRFLEASHKKCAYCEVKLAAGQRQGDVEHYRPKGQVRDVAGKIVKVVVEGVEQKHPGYYWLAYEWTNLLPACAACNRRAGDVSSGTLTGKGEIFPTLDNWWAPDKDQVDAEKPALLNPWVDDPGDHLIFDPETGIVGGRTERGRVTIEVLGLNRDGLPEGRRDAAVQGARNFLDYLGNKGNNLSDPELSRRVMGMVEGQAEYAAACAGAALAALMRVFDGALPELPADLRPLARLCHGSAVGAG